MYVFYIPTQENLIETSSDPPATFKTPIIKRIGNSDVGVIAYYNNEEELEKAKRANYYNVRESWKVFMARNVTEAIKRFYETAEAKIGGSRLVSKAVYIDRARKIVRMPTCPFMEEDKENHRLICYPGGILCALSDPTDNLTKGCIMKSFRKIDDANFSRNLPFGWYDIKKIVVNNTTYDIADLKT